ncbi:MAG: ABC transporter permease, partial [Bryobacterales bacterium]|nr:ABC transporter permease [Bryobacterales bacterium]
VALGAGRWPIFRQMLTESIALGVSGAVGGLVLGQIALDLLITVALPPGAPSGFLTTDLDPQVFVFTLLLGVITGVAFGTYPAITASRIAVADTLKDQSGQVLSSGAARVRKGLVMAQMALSLMLLISAGLFAKSLANVSQVDIGFQPDNLIVFGVSPDLNGYKTSEVRAFAERATEELRALPGVTDAAISEVSFLDGSRWGSNVTVEGYTAPDNDPNPMYANIGPSLLRTLQMQIAAGREFTRADAAGAPKVVMVNEKFAKKYFGDANPIGRRMAVGGGRSVTPDMEIVGVVRDMKYAEVKDEVPMLFYRPLAQTDSMNSFYFYVRGTLPTEAMMAQVRRTMSGIDANLPLEPMRTVEEQLRITTHNDRVIVKMAASFAVLATLLAIVGLYGVMAYNVASRTREIGIRMAFGAGTMRIQSMVIREAAWILALGAAIGIGGALWLTRFAESLLFGVEANDVMVITAATVLIGLVGLLAAFVPARRAAGVDPMTCLRYE